MKHEVESALEKISPHILRTPCERSEALSEACAAEVFLKLENRQTTGSFKLRGVLNKILSLSESDRNRTLVAASTGNHGAAFAHAVSHFGLEGKLFMPVNAAPIKIDGVRAAGIEPELFGNDCVEAERRARTFAEKNGCVWVSPYNDPAVVQGQGTIGFELIEQLEKFDAVLVPVGGGGLIAGVASYLKNSDPSILVLGCQPKNSAVMYESVKAGRIVEMESLPTLSDATAGGIEAGSVTFEMCRKWVDDYILLEN